MSQNAIGWRALTNDQRAGWEALGLLMVRADSLGQNYALNGFGAYCSVNNNKLAAGDAIVAVAPALTAPVNIITATLTLTSAALSLAYTVTPMAANTRIMLYASPQRTAGRSYEADYRLITVTAAAAASPLVALTQYTARLGAPQTGNRIFFSVVAYNGGFRSGPYTFSQVVA